MESTEQWRPVVGYEGAYEVSDLGQVRSMDRLVPCKGGFRSSRGQTLKATPRPSGYLQVGLAGKSALVHSLVARAFLGERPSGYEVCHNNGDPADNRVVNLRIDTISSNRRDTIAHGRNVAANRTHCPQGHPYDETNTGRTADGKARRCLTCHRAREHARHHAKKESR